MDSSLSFITKNNNWEQVDKTGNKRKFSDTQIISTPGPGGQLPHNVLVIPLRVPLRVISHNKSTAGAFVVPFRVFGKKKYDRR